MLSVHVASLFRPSTKNWSSPTTNMSQAFWLFLVASAVNWFTTVENSKDTWSRYPMQDSKLVVVPAATCINKLENQNPLLRWTRRTQSVRLHNKKCRETDV
eukprot:TRINITY_DN56675_c0_g1_i1.p2 TRINITY_DN56675_c0_g1~~TRINITY_DN56675_c0_g1_i1.p2  ORF type:complete len:101 (-),score=7.28 TRINITY_DN56675_c0_g1_i1:196-498(-)